jgi:hypothetical protein
MSPEAVQKALNDFPAFQRQQGAQMREQHKPTAQSEIDAVAKARDISPSAAAHTMPSSHYANHPEMYAPVSTSDVAPIVPQKRPELQGMGDLRKDAAGNFYRHVKDFGHLRVHGHGQGMESDPEYIRQVEMFDQARNSGDLAAAYHIYDQIPREHRAIDARDTHVATQFDGLVSNALHEMRNLWANPRVDPRALDDLLRTVRKAYQRLTPEAIRAKSNGGRTPFERFQQLEDFHRTAMRSLLRDRQVGIFGEFRRGYGIGYRPPGSAPEVLPHEAQLNAEAVKAGLLKKRTYDEGKYITPPLPQQEDEARRRQREDELEEERHGKPVSRRLGALAGAAVRRGMKTLTSSVKPFVSGAKAIGHALMPATTSPQIEQNVAAMRQAQAERFPIPRHLTASQPAAQPEQPAPPAPPPPPPRPITPEYQREVFGAYIRGITERDTRTIDRVDRYLEAARDAYRQGGLTYSQMMDITHTAEDKKAEIERSNKRRAGQPAAPPPAPAAPPPSVEEARREQLTAETNARKENYERLLAELGDTTTNEAIEAIMRRAHWGVQNYTLDREQHLNLQKAATQRIQWLGLRGRSSETFLKPRPVKFEGTKRMMKGQPAEEPAQVAAASLLERQIGDMRTAEDLNKTWKGLGDLVRDGAITPEQLSHLDGVIERRKEALKEEAERAAAAPQPPPQEHRTWTLGERNSAYRSVIDRIGACKEVSEVNQLVAQAGEMQREGQIDAGHLLQVEDAAETKKARIAQANKPAPAPAPKPEPKPAPKPAPKPEPEPPSWKPQVWQPSATGEYGVGAVAAATGARRRRKASPRMETPPVIRDRHVAGLMADYINGIMQAQTMGEVNLIRERIAELFRGREINNDVASYLLRQADIREADLNRPGEYEEEGE